MSAAHGEFKGNFPSAKEKVRHGAWLRRQQEIPAFVPTLRREVDGDQFPRAAIPYTHDNERAYTFWQRIGHDPPFLRHLARA